METIAALELVVGFPVLATVSAAQRGTLRIATDGNVYGLNLETGLRVAPEQAVVHAPPIDFVTTSVSGDRKAWVIDNMSYPLSRPLGVLTVGNDDRLVSCTYETISVYDRARFAIRTVRVPKPIDLKDRVTGGMQGDLGSQVLYVEPGFLVFVRTPALLVVALADVERALVFDDTVWSIQNILAVREPDKTLAARRGKWNGGKVTSETGALDIETRLEPVRVCDLMWPPNGWAEVEVADGSRVPAHKRPREHRTANVDVVHVALSSTLDRKTKTTWPVVHPPLPPQPPATHRELRIIPQPTVKGAVAYAKELHLDDAAEQLKSYPRKSGKVLDWRFPARSRRPPRPCSTARPAASFTWSSRTARLACRSFKPALPTATPCRSSRA